MKISVLTPTIRGRGLEIMQQCLERQTLTDFEWLTEVGLPKKTGYDINAAFNRMIRRAKGELLVFYQDHTKIMDDGLERFWKAYQERPDTLFTAPLGKVDNFDDPHPRWDWRATKQKATQTDYTDSGPRTCELDWGAIPKKVLYDIGGFDEEFDKHWSGDNVSVGIRADMKGYKFACLFTNPAVAFDHDKFKPNPMRDKFDGTFIADRCLAYQAGLTVDFLREQK